MTFRKALRFGQNYRSLHLEPWNLEIRPMQNVKQFALDVFFCSTGDCSRNLLLSRPIGLKRTLSKRGQCKSDHQLIPMCRVQGVPGSETTFANQHQRVPSPEAAQSQTRCSTLFMPRICSTIPPSCAFLAQARHDTNLRLCRTDADPPRGACHIEICNSISMQSPLPDERTQALLIIGLRAGYRVHRDWITNNVLRSLASASQRIFDKRPREG